jgi:sphingomyelin phosphodiesterase
MGYVAPSMTPTSGSPSFRVYEVDPVTFGITDFTQYIANISDPSYQIKPKWKPYYSAKQAYGSKLSPPVQDPSAEMTPAFWHNVTIVMEQDVSVFQAFWARRTRGNNVTSCTGNCMTNEICALRGADAQYNCATPTVGFSFRKRDVTSEPSLQEEKFRPECNHAGMGPLLAKIVHQAVLEKEKEVEHTR